MSLLAHRTFNVSIPSSHIPQQREPLPEGSTGEETFQFAFGASSPAEEQEEGEDENADLNNYAFPEEERGNWISSWTGFPISGSDGSRPVKFTVIGYDFATSLLNPPATNSSTHHE